MEHPEDFTKYSFASIPALFLLVLAYVRCYRHKTIQRTSLSVCYVVMKNLPDHQSYAITINVSYMHQCKWIFGLAPSVSLRHAACERQWNWLQQHVYIHPTENKDRQFDNFAITGGTVHCQLRQNCQFEGIFCFQRPFPCILTAAIMNTLSPNEVLMSY